MTRHLLEGSPSPMGANWDGQGVNFALFSANAEKVELCLFDESGKKELKRLELPGVNDHVWHGYLPDCTPGTIYGYRVYGPYQPRLGHRFNHHKLLLDPYAKQLTGAVNWHESVYGFNDRNPESELSFNTRDSARYVPKSVVVDEAFDWGNDQAPRIPWSQTIIYETHVRGFTRLHPDIEAASRGSFAALGSPVVISYLKSLGITSIELLPVHEFIDDYFLVHKNLSNYWGYNTLGFFAPASRYLASGDRNEFKAMVKQLHQASIEVILDVVYNHTAEGSQDGPTLSFRGIDNASYYRLPEDDASLYVNDSGCGNSINASHPRVLQMIIDSLRYWVTEMHVDGFRFDLAVSLGRESQGFDNNSEFFKLIREDEVLSQVKLIAEPWDIGSGGYQLGAFPIEWAEWNDRFRDCVRRFWRGDHGVLPELARSLHGSSDLFEHNGRRPSASINLITSHDGFTLTDLVSYNKRNNQANREDNRDGHSANFSNNYGIEGDSNDPEINKLRQRQRRNLLATMFLVPGTPMLLAGDELGHSQQGNNNAYCQDNDITWQDWSALDRESEMLDFVRHLIRIRNLYPLLHRDRYVHGEEQFEPSGFTDIQWLGADGQVLQDAEWHDKQHNFLAMMLAGEARPDSDLSINDVNETVLIIAFNADPAPVNFMLPGTQYNWHCVLDTAIPEPAATEHGTVEIEPRSVQMFELKM